MAYGCGVLFDWVALTRRARFKGLFWALFLLFHGLALWIAVVGAPRFQLAEWLSTVGWVLTAVFAFLLVYSLFWELPTEKTYVAFGGPNRLVTTGMYALARHPGVLWYILTICSLILATRSMVLLVVGPVWAALDVAYAVIEDRVFFPRLFPHYRHYQEATPMLIPTYQSVRAALRTSSLLRGGVKRI